MPAQVNRWTRLVKDYSQTVISTICRLVYIALIFASQPISGARADEPKSDPWMMYRIMGLDDLRLSLSQMERRLEILRVEVARSRKLVASGAAPQSGAACEIGFGHRQPGRETTFDQRSPEEP